MNTISLERLFSPRSIAIIGASHTPGKLGYDVLKNTVQYGYKGEVYPINPTASAIAGRVCYPSVKQVPGNIDVAVIAVPAVAVASVLTECGEKQIPFVIIISAGFKEIGEEGKQHEQELLRIAEKYHIRLVGPNCLGLINAHNQLNASFTAGMPKAGNIALISQSGAMNVAMLDWAKQSQLGFSKILSVGNKSDIDEVECLNYLATDTNTSVIMLYLESLEHGQAFMEAASRITPSKPIIVLKAGASQQAQRAIRSHTGSLTGSEEAINAGFKKCGVIRAATIEQFFDYGLTFSTQPLPRHDKIVIITNAGGPGIMAVDAAQYTKLDIFKLNTNLQQLLKTQLPAAAGTKNPIDVIGDASAERYEHALNVLLADKTIAGAIAILTPQTMTQVNLTAEKIVSAAKRYGKPVLASFMGGAAVQSGRDYLEEHQIPNYETPERAVLAMDQLIKQVQRKIKPFKFPKISSHNVITAQNHPQISTITAEQLLMKYKLPVLRSQLIKTVADCNTIKQFPVVIKIASRDVIHKAAAGAVLLNINNVTEAQRAFKQITQHVHKKFPKAEIEGMLVQKQIPLSRKAKEVIIGMKRDVAFGPVIMFGLGGGMVELLHDVTFGIAPLSKLEAEHMINAIHTAPLLVHNDKAAIVQALLAVSKLALDYPNISELDINPLMVHPTGKGAHVIDVRILPK
ncbi:MAG: acetate--CoA ligase family protein [Patescibacteria group bacterium]|jgi:acetyltransferase